MMETMKTKNLRVLAKGQVWFDIASQHLRVPLRQLLFPFWAGGFASSSSPDFAISVIAIQL